MTTAGHHSAICPLGQFSFSVKARVVTHGLNPVQLLRPELEGAEVVVPARSLSARVADRRDVDSKITNEVRRLGT
jgi:hypothetical protein